jgi:hypothetical protein
VVCTIATSASRRDSSHSPLMPPQRPVPHRPRISWSKPAHLIRLETVTDFDRSCFRMRPAERFSLSRPLKFPFRSNFQQGQSGHQNLRRELKAESMKFGIPTQLVWRRTLRLIQGSPLTGERDVQDIATRAWNFITALITKLADRRGD